MVHCLLMVIARKSTGLLLRQEKPHSVGDCSRGAMFRRLRRNWFGGTVKILHWLNE